MHRGTRQMGDELHPVADPQHGDAEAQDLRVGGGRSGIEHRARPAGEDDALGGERLDPGEVPAGRMDFTVHVRLAHAPRDELSELGAVIEDQDAVHARYQVVGSAFSPRSRSSRVSRWRAT